LLAGLCVGAWYVYARCNWISWVPSRLLLAVNEGGVSRLEHGTLETLRCRYAICEQADRLLASSLRTPKGLIIRNPHSAGVEIEIRLEVTKDMFAGGWRLWCPTRQVTVDGQPVSITDAVPAPDLTTGSVRTGGDRYCMRISRLPPGPHQIWVALTYELLPESAITRELRASLRTTLSLSTSLLVEDRPITAYVREVWESDVDRSASFRLRPSRDPRLGFMSVDLGGLPMPVAARLEYCAAGASTYKGLLTVYVPGGQRCTWGFSLFQTERLQPGSTVDIRLVPDIEAAWHAGYTSCFGGTVEWSSVPVPSGSDTFVPVWPTTAPSASYLLPTRIYHATATRPSE